MERRTIISVVAMLLTLAGIGVWLAAVSSDAATDDEESIADEVITQPLLAAAEGQVTRPNATHARALLDELGGIEAVTIATAEGAFDVVSFDPTNSEILLASHRLSYGRAENQARNEEWRVVGGEVEQTLWNPGTAHDFAYFNSDGSVTMWSHGGGPGFAPRSATIIGQIGAIETVTAPIFASRAAEANGTIFALTSDGHYNSRGYVELIAHDGSSLHVLDDAGTFKWIDTPTSELLLAYSVGDRGGTAVWDTSSLERLIDHPLAQRSYVRLAVSGDERVAVAVNTRGQLELLDFASGELIERFGDGIDVSGIDGALTLNEDGTVLVTVETHGVVTLWWVATQDVILRIDGDASQPRWLSEEYAAKSSTVVAPDASRIALRLPAAPGVPIQWKIIDIDVAAWIDRACEEVAIELGSLAFDDLRNDRHLSACSSGEQ
jgi:hypothetical protein